MGAEGGGRGGPVDVDVQKCRAFVETVRLGSFTLAARRLGFSQSGVSRMVADLERAWGVELLERGRGGVRLTADGACLLPCAQRVCDAAAALESEVDAVHGLEAGVVRIGTFSSVASQWLPPVIREFRALYPGIDYELLLGDYTEILTWIREGRVDCGFVRSPLPDDLEVIPVGRDQLMAVLPPDHELAGERAFPVERLADWPFLALASSTDDMVSVVFREAGVPFKPKLSTWDDFAIMSMVESGQGISILPSLILRRIPYDVVALPLSVPAYREIGLCMRSLAATPVAARRFVEHVRAARFE